MPNPVKIKAKKTATTPAIPKEQSTQKKHAARLINSPAILSAVVTESYEAPITPELDINYLLDELNDSIDKIKSGNLAELEAMLLGQAKALQTMFMSLARRASKQEYLKQYSAYMNLALKSQSQSRATIQTLIELKYPRQVIVTQQANITHGNQQVNNGVATQSSPQTKDISTHAGKNQNEPNELMGSNHDKSKDTKSQPQRLDSRTAQSPISGHTALEAVAAVHRG